MAFRSARPFACFAFAAPLAACAQFPEIDAANRGSEPAGAPPPLLAYEDLLAATGEGPLGETSPTEDFASLEARQRALEARAAILRQPAEDIDALRARLARLP
ncbi:MAG: hypothetical protein AAF871_15860 [Pseudomonadota bacterium]